MVLVHILGIESLQACPAPARGVAHGGLGGGWWRGERRRSCGKEEYLLNGYYFQLSHVYAKIPFLIKTSDNEFQLLFHHNLLEKKRNLLQASNRKLIGEYGTTTGAFPSGC
jgi:hypothetical protein